jgi:hypothetical protein
MLQRGGGEFFKEVKNQHGDFDWKNNANTNLLNTFFEIFIFAEMRLEVRKNTKWHYIGEDFFSLN